jgi:2-polyprenyl-6-methoxyphenol hydroxylase-like FAD-dependent oxidoreductase
MKSETEVLVVGAGPTGLVLALWLAHLGVRVRIVDKTAAPGTTSRALVVHARILEFYDQIDLAREVVNCGLKMRGANLWVAGEPKGRIVFGDMGQGISPFPYALIFPQDEHERLLIGRLKALGIVIERRTELISFEDTGARVTAHLRRPDGREEVVESLFIAGCDGAHSTVREVLNVSFPGGTYSHIFYVADVEASTSRAMNGEVQVGLDEAEFLAIFPLKGVGRARLIGTVKREAEARRNLTFEDVSTRLMDKLDIKIERVNWFSTYNVHHRVAKHFRKGRAFLLGDAAHIHSPVGGQGMNTGIGDAINLAWKLAMVVQKRSAISLLGSYEPERIVFARRLVATTDRAFQFINRDGAVARFVRVRLVPLLSPEFFRFRAVRRLMFLTISQTNVNYRSSKLSVGSVGGVRAGDRLPWVRQEDGTDNFAALRSLDWQAHVYGDAHTQIERACARAALSLRRFPWSDAAGKAGIARNAFYLVRPDGYMGLAAAIDAPAALRAYQTRLNLIFGEAARPLPQAGAPKSEQRS